MRSATCEGATLIIRGEGCRCKSRIEDSNVLEGELEMAKLVKMGQGCEIIAAGRARRWAVSSATIMEGPGRYHRERSEDEDTTINESACKASEDILAALPNDLTRLVYLASIRDYNSGTYRHPILSRQFDATTADQAFEICHQQVFARLLADPISKYVEQLEGYIRYSRAERSRFIAVWKSLQAYKATIPLKVPRRACEAFFLNIKTALTILELPLRR